MADEWDGPFFEGIKKLSKLKMDLMKNGTLIENYFNWGDEKLISILKTSKVFKNIVKEINKISCTKMHSDIYNGKTDYVGPYGLLFELENEKKLGKIFNGITLKCKLKQPKCIYIRFEGSGSESNFNGSSVHRSTIQYTVAEKQVFNDWNSSFPDMVGPRQVFSGCIIKVKGLTPQNDEIDLYRLAITIIHESIHYYQWYLAKKEIINRTTRNRKCQVPVEKTLNSKFQDKFIEFIADEKKTRQMEMKCSNEIWASIPAADLMAMSDSDRGRLKSYLQKDTEYTNTLGIQLSLNTSAFPITYLESFVISALKNELTAYVASSYIENVKNTLYMRLKKRFNTETGTLDQTMLNTMTPWDFLYKELEPSELNEVYKHVDFPFPRDSEIFEKVCALLFAQILLSLRWNKIERVVTFFSDDTDQSRSIEKGKQDRLKMAKEHLKRYFGSESFMDINSQVRYYSD
jgi:hypothetical protein